MIFVAVREKIRPRSLSSDKRCLMLEECSKIWAQHLSVGWLDVGENTADFPAVLF